MNRPLAILAAVVTLTVVLLASQGNTYTYVDAEGPRLRMLSAGSGAPAVVFENGMGGELTTWRRVQDVIGRDTTAIAYNRAGVGDSNDGPLPRDSRQAAIELHAALRNSGVPPPYVLVGHSIGGLYVRVYAALYPDEVAALVLVDPTRHDEVAPETLADTAYPELNAMAAAMQQAHEAQIADDLPVYLIVAMGARDEPWFTEADADGRARFAAERAEDLAAHTAWVRALGNGHLIVTENSGHVVPVEEPEVVVATIRRALAEL